MLRGMACCPLELRAVNANGGWGGRNKKLRERVHRLISRPAHSLRGWNALSYAPECIKAPHNSHITPPRGGLGGVPGGYTWWVNLWWYTLHLRRENHRYSSVPLTTRETTDAAVTSAGRVYELDKINIRLVPVGCPKATQVCLRT